MEECESGRIGTIGNRVKGNLPWVQIPPPPPRGVYESRHHLVTKVTSRSPMRARTHRDGLAETKVSENQSAGESSARQESQKGPTGRDSSRGLLLKVAYSPRRRVRQVDRRSQTAQRAQSGRARQAPEAEVLGHEFTERIGFVTRAPRPLSDQTDVGRDRLEGQHQARLHETDHATEPALDIDVGR
jgi:hypothetical protein